MKDLKMNMTSLIWLVGGADCSDALMIEMSILGINDDRLRGLFGR